MNNTVAINYRNLKPTLFLLPLFLLIAVVLFLYNQNALNAKGYTQVQKEAFIYINHHLGQYPALQINLTQLGNGLIFLSFLSILILYAPKIWEALVSGLLFSVLFSSLLKGIFSMPRPAASFDHKSFIIIGEKLTGHNSLPSGHSITIFTLLTVLMFGMMPSQRTTKVLWFVSVMIIGLTFAISRVGVGAHFPIDVIAGCIIGYISGLLGIFFNKKYPICSWISNKKYYPIFMLLFVVCCVVLIQKIAVENLMIFYFSLASLVFSLYKIVNVYAKK